MKALEPFDGMHEGSLSPDELAEIRNVHSLVTQEAVLLSPHSARLYFIHARYLATIDCLQDQLKELRSQLGGSCGQLEMSSDDEFVITMANGNTIRGKFEPGAPLRGKHPEILRWFS